MFVCLFCLLVFPWIAQYFSQCSNSAEFLLKHPFVVALKIKMHVVAV